MKKIESFLFLRVLVLFQLLLWRAYYTLAATAATNSVPLAMVVSEAVDVTDTTNTSTTRRVVEECYLYSKNFSTAKTDPDAVASTVSTTGGTYYNFLRCEGNTGWSDFYALTNHFPSCGDIRRKNGSTGSGSNCFAQTVEARLSCCVGDGTDLVVVFKYYSKDLSVSISTSTCGTSDQYTSATVFPHYYECSEWYGDFEERDTWSQQANGTVILQRPCPDCKSYLSSTDSSSNSSNAPNRFPLWCLCSGMLIHCYIHDPRL